MALRLLGGLPGRPGAPAAICCTPATVHTAGRALAASAAAQAVAQWRSAASSTGLGPSLAPRAPPLATGGWPSSASRRTLAGGQANARWLGGSERGRGRRAQRPLAALSQCLPSSLQPAAWEALERAGTRLKGFYCACHCHEGVAPGPHRDHARRGDPPHRWPRPPGRARAYARPHGAQPQCARRPAARAAPDRRPQPPRRQPGGDG